MNVLQRIRMALELDPRKYPGQTPEMTDAQLQQLLAALGGEQVVIPRTTRGKPGREATPDDLAHRAYMDALASQDPMHKVAARHGIGRSTLYRLIKRGPPK